VDHADPDLIARCEPLGLDWHDVVLEVMRLSLWAALVRTYVPLEDILDDAQFRRQFEMEWRRLLDYRGMLFNFRVVPALSAKAVARYHALHYGDVPIRNMIVSYIVHQATAYPHLPADFWPDMHSALYTEQLPHLFTPLVEAEARQALLQSLGSLEGVTTADKERLEAVVTERAWEAFREAVDKFRFHFPYKGKPSPLGKKGILGLAESPDERRRFDAF
jgi:hypothetical protein